jgi:hypothetical protein
MLSHCAHTLFWQRIVYSRQQTCAKITHLFSAFKWCIFPFLLSLFKSGKYEVVMTPSVKWVSHDFGFFFFCNFRICYSRPLCAVQFITSAWFGIVFTLRCMNCQAAAVLLQKNCSTFVLLLNGSYGFPGEVGISFVPYH